MQQHIIAGIVLSVVFVILLGLYLSSYQRVSKDTIIFLLSILQVISIFFVFFSTPTVSPNHEGFFFEVSPERKKCLVEQVSLDKSRRSCSCCQKGTVGGILPYVADWSQPEGRNELWKRTDNWTTDPNNVAYETQFPATELVKQMKKK
jgi:hypothetical protein